MKVVKKKEQENQREKEIKRGEETEIKSGKREGERVEPAREKWHVSSTAERNNISQRASWCEFVGSK